MHIIGFAPVVDGLVLHIPEQSSTGGLRLFWERERKIPVQFRFLGLPAHPGADPTKPPRSSRISARSNGFPQPSSAGRSPCRDMASSHAPFPWMHHISRCERCRRLPLASKLGDVAESRLRPINTHNEISRMAFTRFHMLAG